MISLDGFNMPTLWFCTPPLLIHNQLMHPDFFTKKKSFSTKGGIVVLQINDTIPCTPRYDLLVTFAPYNEV